MPAMVGDQGSGHRGRSVDWQDRRAVRQAQLAQQSDAELDREIAVAQAAHWRPRRLRAHARKHWQDFADILGHGLVPVALDELSQSTLGSWNGLFTEREPSGDNSFIFAGDLPDGNAILIVVTREGVIRTAFPADDIAGWLRRHPAAIEVTSRVLRHP